MEGTVHDRRQVAVFKKAKDSKLTWTCNVWVPLPGDCSPYTKVTRLLLPINRDDDDDSKEYVPKEKKRVSRAEDKMSHSHTNRSVKSPHWSADYGGQREPIEASGDMMHISAKALNITWGSDPRFWQWVPLPKGSHRFEAAAELIQVNWMHVKGTLDLAKYKLSPSRTYEIVYLIKFKVDAFGWQEAPITFQVVTPNGRRESRSVNLEPCRSSSAEWHEIPGGEFTAPSEMSGKLEFSMSETRTNWWKGGLILEGVTIRPKKT